MPANLKTTPQSAPFQDQYSTLYNTIVGNISGKKLVAYKNEYGSISYKYEGEETNDFSKTSGAASDPINRAVDEAKALTAQPKDDFLQKQMDIGIGPSPGGPGVADGMGNAAGSPGDAGVAGIGDATGISGTAEGGNAASDGSAGAGAAGVGGTGEGGVGGSVGTDGAGSSGAGAGGGGEAGAFAEGGFVNKGKQVAKPPVVKTPEGLMARSTIEEEEPTSNIPPDKSEPIMSLIDAFTAGDINKEQLMVELMGLMEPQDNVMGLTDQAIDRKVMMDAKDQEMQGLMAKGQAADMSTGVGKMQPKQGYAEGGPVKTAPKVRQELPPMQNPMGTQGPGMQDQQIQQLMQENQMLKQQLQQMQPQPNSQPAAYAHGGMVKNYAAGGPVDTPGRVAVDPAQDMEDSIPVGTDTGGQAKLNNGEYVIPAPAVRQIGVEKLNKLVQKAMTEGGQTEQIKPAGPSAGQSPGLMAPPSSPAAPKQATSTTGMLSLPSSSRLPAGMSDQMSRIS